jgi:hypothetical protein
MLACIFPFVRHEPGEPFFSDLPDWRPRIDEPGPARRHESEPADAPPPEPDVAVLKPRRTAAVRGPNLRRPKEKDTRRWAPPPRHRTCGGAPTATQSAGTRNSAPAAAGEAARTPRSMRRRARAGGRGGLSRASWHPQHTGLRLAPWKIQLGGHAPQLLAKAES